MPSTVGTALATDRTELRTRTWRAHGADPAKASIVLVHGVGEHSGRYEHVGDSFASAGFDVDAYDQRGFGGSRGRRAWVATWDVVHSDLQGRVEAARTAAGGRPVVLLGHSLGGLIALGYVVGGRPLPDLLVVSAPGLEDRLAGWKKELARLLDRIAPGMRIDAGIMRGMLVSSPREGFQYADDPLVETATTAHFGALGLAEEARVRIAIDRLEHLPIPTLAVHGGADPLVPPSASARLERLPEVTRIVYPGLRHETHNEAASTTVADIARWLDERVAVLQSVHN